MWLLGLKAFDVNYKCYTEDFWYFEVIKQLFVMWKEISCNELSSNFSFLILGNLMWSHR